MDLRYRHFAYGERRFYLAAECDGFDGGIWYQVRGGWSYLLVDFALLVEMDFVEEYCTVDTCVHVTYIMTLNPLHKEFGMSNLMMWQYYMYECIKYLPTVPVWPQFNALSWSPAHTLSHSLSRRIKINELVSSPKNKSPPGTLKYCHVVKKKGIPNQYCCFAVFRHALYKRKAKKKS